MPTLRLQECPPPLFGGAGAGGRGHFSFSQVGLAEADVVAARMVPNPGLSVGAGRSSGDLRVAAAAHADLGQRGAHIRAAQRGVDQSRAEARFALWRLRHDGRVAYYGAARGDEEVLIAQEVEALTRKVADIAGERFETGAGNRLEKEQAGLVHAEGLAGRVGSAGGGADGPSGSFRG